MWVLSFHIERISCLTNYQNGSSIAAANVGGKLQESREIKKPVASIGLQNNVAERFITFLKSRNINHSATVILSNRALKLSISTSLPILQLIAVKEAY